MSETNKPRQFFSYTDFECNGDNMNSDDCAHVANEKLAPVLKIMDEMAEAIETQEINFCEVLNKYKTFKKENGLDR